MREELSGPVGEHVPNENDSRETDKQDSTGGLKNESATPPGVDDFAAEGDLGGFRRESAPLVIPDDYSVFKPNVNPAYAWEPIVCRGGRALGRDVPTVRDWVMANITLRRGMVGAKPQEFAEWLFRFMGLEPSDEFHDLYPGSGSVTKACVNVSSNGGSRC